MSLRATGPTIRGSVNRVALIGDSHLNMGYARIDLPTSAGTFVVASGVATISVGGNANLAVGNYVYFINRNDSPTYRDALNGAYVPVTGVSSNSVFTVSAKFNGQTMPDGDYSSIRGQWSIIAATAKTDSSWLNWLRAFNQDPFMVTSIQAAVGQTAQDMVTLFPRVLAGPAFDVGIFSLGTNEMQTSPSSAAMAQCYACFANVTNMASQLLAMGIQVIISTNNPDNIANGNTVPKAEAMATYRFLILQWARRRPNVQIVDTYALVADGTVTTGLPITNYVKSGDNHISTFGDYNVAKELTNPWPKIITSSDIQPVTLLDDNATYSQIATAWVGSTSYSVNNIVSNGANVYRCITAGTSASSGGPTGRNVSIVDGTVTWAWVAGSSVNLVQHGLMDGSSGNNNTAGALTGNVPSNWNLAVSGLASGTTTPQSARAVVGNSAKWGFGWQISAAFTAVNQSWTASQDMISRLVKGCWYRFGVTITALNGWGSNVSSMRVLLTMGGGTMFFQPQAIYAGNNTTTYPLLTNDSMEWTSDPFFVDPNWNGTQMIFTITQIAAASPSGSVNTEIASAWCRQIEDPTSY